MEDDAAMLKLWQWVQSQLEEMDRQTSEQTKGNA